MKWTWIVRLSKRERERERTFRREVRDGVTSDLLRIGQSDWWQHGGELVTGETVRLKRVTN